MRNIIVDIDNKMKRREPLTAKEDFVLGRLCLDHENEVISKIRARQSAISGLIRDQGGYNCRWGRDLSPGCQICMEQGFVAVRSNSTCNLTCKFCYHYGAKNVMLPEHFKFTTMGGNLFTLDDMKIIISEQGKKERGFCWVWGEPLMEFKKILPLMLYINSLGKHQHLYTNGTLLTEDGLKTLRDNGLNEIRFNLAATRCSNKVIDLMRVAVKYIPYVCIESPMYGEFYRDFMAKRKEILETGVRYFNAAELHLNGNNINNYPYDPLYVLKYGYVSPIESRQLTYDLIEVASREEWPIVINDCSNERKWYRGVKNSDMFGVVNYNAEMPTPILRIWDSASERVRERLKCEMPR